VAGPRPSFKAKTRPLLLRPRQRPRKTITEEAKICTTAAGVTGTQYMELNAHGRMVLNEQ